jgi:transcriptional regulator GlxA family with amidase domain
LAHRAGMSSRTFARRFHESVGVTPHRWVQRQRVQLAQRLLEVTDCPSSRWPPTAGWARPQTCASSSARCWAPPQPPTAAPSRSKRGR